VKRARKFFWADLEHLEHLEEHTQFDRESGVLKITQLVGIRITERPRGHLDEASAAVVADITSSFSSDISPH